MAYKSRFSLNPGDIDLIEECLRREVSKISHDISDSKNQLDAKLEDRLSDIRMLMGKIHNQKIWYMGTGDVMRVPRG